jgi:hypothetical protein
MGNKNNSNRPVIICEACGKPILNPISNNAKTHTSRIKGIKSKCQELRDLKHRNIFNKANKDKHKKPLNKSTEKSVMRYCLGPHCQGKKMFRSISIHHRQCGKCYNTGYDRTAVKVNR